MVVCLFVLGFWQTTSLSRVHPAFCSMGIWIGTSPPTMGICIGGRKRMDEYLCRTVKFYLLSFLMPFWLDCSWKGDFKSQWDFSARKIKNILNLFAEHWSQLLSCDRNVLCCSKWRRRSWAIWEIICNCLKTQTTLPLRLWAVFSWMVGVVSRPKPQHQCWCDVTFGVRLRQWWRQQVLYFWCCFWPVVYLTTATSKTPVYAHVAFYCHVSEFPKLFRGQWCNS